ncbi:hypothetical protein IFM89_028574 [Coptis chinensis]|uniref:Uncharacterized protein n=1 Tax=Coptis chinensis TaxID=261450 RepID=A0A835II31_9MAGN|nr:hypothetical protein IFM89_028574 [Coptis chinensis]
MGVVSIIENAAFVHGEPSQDDNKSPPRVDSEAIILHEKVTKTIIKEGRGENPSKYSTCFYPNIDTYVIFGEAKIEDLSSQPGTPAVRSRFKAPDLSHVISKPESSAMAQDDEDVDETGVEPKDKISDDAG